MSHALGGNLLFSRTSKTDLKCDVDATTDNFVAAHARGAAKRHSTVPPPAANRPREQHARSRHFGPGRETLPMEGQARTRLGPEWATGRTEEEERGGQGMKAPPTRWIF